MNDKTESFFWKASRTQIPRHLKSTSKYSQLKFIHWAITASFLHWLCSFYLRRLLEAFQSRNKLLPLPTFPSINMNLRHTWKKPNRIYEAVGIMLGHKCLHPHVCGLCPLSFLEQEKTTAALRTSKHLSHVRHFSRNIRGHFSTSFKLCSAFFFFTSSF